MVRHKLVSGDPLLSSPHFWLEVVILIDTELWVICGSSHYIVPELGPEVKFSYASHKAVKEYQEAKAVCALNQFSISVEFLNC